MSITIFKQEIADGIGDLVRANASVAYSVLPTVSLVDADRENKVKAFLKSSGKQIETLYFLDAILASLGWNVNTDVFSKADTWAAKDTPVHKPFNYMHIETDIIGSMIASSVIGPDGQAIASDTPIEQVPDQFDILVSSVLYKVWEDKALQERMDRIIADIQEGKWFVSMECLFAGFDYAVISPAGEQKVIGRNEQSAFLTKHLRAYGGSGEYEGHKLGRLLRNFVFSAKGLVDNPANKRSIILNKSVPFNGTSASIKGLTKGRKMEPNDILKAQLDEAKKNLEAALAENKDFQAKAQKVAEEASAKKVAALEAQIEELKKTVSAKDTELATAKEAATKAEKVVAEKDTKVADLEKQIADQKVAAVKASRLAKLATANVPAEEAAKLVEKFASASDEIFDEFVAAKAAFPFKKDEDKKDKKDEKKDAKASEDKSDTTDDKAGEAKADATDVDGLQADKDAALAAGEDKTDTLRTQASNWIKEKVFKTTASKSDKK